MNVCTCNALSEREISWAVRDGAASPTQVFASLNCAPQCGKCLPMLRDAVRAGLDDLDGRPVIAAE